MDVRRRGALVTGFALWLALAAPSRVHADEAGTEPTPPPPALSPARRALAVTAAIVPGVIVRGAGHWVARDRPTARRLLYLEAVGLALAAAGGIPVGLSGAAGETMPGLALLLPGTGLLVTSFAADVWGAAGGARVAGRPLAPDALVLSAGYTYLIDPRVPFDHLATAAVDARRGRGLFAASGWAGDSTWRAAVTAGVRLLGPRPGAAAITDGSSLDVTVTGADEHRADQGFSVLTGDAAVRGRLDLVHIAPSLRGSHVRAALGLGGERVRYTAAGVADLAGILVYDFAWGFTLGDGHDRALEAELTYQHRRDTLAGGVTLPLPGNGFVGSFGLTATTWRNRWGTTVTVEAGSAWVLSFAARVRLPEVSP